MILITGAVMLTALASTNQTQDARVFSGTGSHARRVTTESAKAQRFFNQGLNFMFAFNHDEAIRSFRVATAADPKCAMAWWGIATANGPHINNPLVPIEREREAMAALRKANELIKLTTPVEAELIRAATLRFSAKGMEARPARDRAYANAMRKVWKRHANDADVGALFAESMMDLRAWDLWTPAKKAQPGTPEILQTLDRVMKVNPNHPLALHLAIHAWEASPTPERADAAANRLRDLQPGLGHMVHMPSHIDVLRGRWHESILANEKAMRADARYQKLRPRQGFYNLYMTHNRHMLGFSAMMTGQREKSIRAMDEVVAKMPKAWVKQFAVFADAFVATPLEARVRFGMWDEVLAWPEYPEYLPFSRAIRHMGRGVAFAAKGQTFEAEAEHALFREARAKVPAEVTVGNSPSSVVLDLADHLLAGEIHLAANRMDDALREIRQAVHAEDQLRYDEPPDWMIPTRHILGVALLKAGKPAEAERVYRQDLKRLPNNGWSLAGLTTALERQGKNTDAKRTRLAFNKVWRNADMQIESSCMCVPKP